MTKLEFPKLSETEEKVMTAFMQNYDPDIAHEFGHGEEIEAGEWGLTFASIEKRSGVKQPRRHVRALARKGLLHLNQIFSEDDGLCAGSGYFLTNNLGVPWAEAKRQQVREDFERLFGAWQEWRAT